MILLEARESDLAGWPGLLTKARLFKPSRFARREASSDGANFHARRARGRCSAAKVTAIRSRCRREAWARWAAIMFAGCGAPPSCSARRPARRGRTSWAPMFAGCRSPPSCSARRPARRRRTSSTRRRDVVFGFLVDRSIKRIQTRFSKFFEKKIERNICF